MQPEEMFSGCGHGVFIFCFGRHGRLLLNGANGFSKLAFKPRAANRINQNRLVNNIFWLSCLFFGFTLIKIKVNALLYMVKMLRKLPARLIAVAGTNGA